MANNLVSGLILTPLAQICIPKFFPWILPLLCVWHCCKLSLHAISRKINEPAWENGKRPSFRTDFGPFDPNLGPKNFFSWILSRLNVRHCCRLSLYAISRKTTWTKLEKITKNLVLGPILVHLTQIWATNSFFKNLAPSVTRYYGQLSSCTISEKTNNPILRKLSDGQTDRQRD